MIVNKNIYDKRVLFEKDTGLINNYIKKLISHIDDNMQTKDKNENIIIIDW